MHSLRSLFMKTVLVLCLLAGFATVSMADEAFVPTHIQSAEDALAAQAAAAKKAADIEKQALNAMEEARIAKEHNDSEKAAAYEAIAIALSKAQQAYKNVAELYGKAAAEFDPSKVEEFTLKILLAESAELNANDIIGQAEEGLKHCRNGEYTLAMSAAAKVDQFASKMLSAVVEGGEGEAGAGVTEQEGEQETAQDGTPAAAGVSTITSPVMHSSPSAFSGSGGRPTASGF